MLGFISGLDTASSIFLILCILAVCFYETINGFHDTANAVATVIYTRTLKPQVAVVWSGLWNFLGVWVGGIAVAMGMIKMLPLNDLLAMSLGQNIALVMAILLAAIIWNLGTWYVGIPCSSSHALTGSLLGGGFAFWFINGGAGVNWHKAQEIFLSLLLSPFLGFGLAVLLMFILKSTIKSKVIFKEPDAKKAPPLWIRAVLVVTCTLVSFFHGSNDGQKGVGLMLVVLISFLPMQFALNSNLPLQAMKSSVAQVETAVRTIPEPAMDARIKDILTSSAKVTAGIDIVSNSGQKADILNLRKMLQVYSGDLQTAINNNSITGETAKVAKAEIASLKESYEFAPLWVKALIAFSLGIGTMVGWKRIVVTIGEKIGKSHLTYAQGASAELVASTTIGLSTLVGLPVSTTHVLSSGIAGTMVASGGTKNLDRKTIKSIGLAWLLTLPVTFVSSALLYWIFRLFA